jgi:hypothetical protein
MIGQWDVAEAQTPSGSPTRIQPAAPQTPTQTSPPAITAYPACEPPATAEFLLLVVTSTSASQTQVGQLLPPNTTIATCTYLEDTVTRVGGFRTVERANAWARYITESTGLAAYVARPAETASSAANTSSPNIPQPNPSTPAAQPPAIANPPAPQQTSPTLPKRDNLAYAPKPLSTGYAVLVDYANKPQVAAQLQKILTDAEIGLVSYNQRPYLLATHSADSTAAYRILRTLSDRGFSAKLVDSRLVILLKQPVASPR